MNPQVRLELEQLLAGLCDGTLADDGHARLEELLAGDAACRRFYLEYVDLHARLLVGPPSKDEVGRMKEESEPTGSSFILHPSSFPRRRLAPYVAPAAAVLAAAVLLAVLWRTARGPGGGAGDGVPVATLSQTTDCAWEVPGRDWQSGQRVGLSELRLARGVARLRFDAGPELVLEGPATLRVDGALGATLRLGKLVFRDDAAGPPFELHTPSAALVGLGTEYGVSVGPGVEEIHVFEGELRRTALAGGEPELLGGGEARRYAAGGPAAGTPAELDGPKFIRRLPVPARPDPAGGLLAYEGFDYAEPDALAGGRAAGGFGWAGAWRGPRAMTRQGRPGPALDPRGGLTRPGSPATGGAFAHAGPGRYGRRLAHPIALDEDGAYYLSFLFRRGQSPPEATGALVVALKAGDDGADREARRRRLSLGVGGDNQLCCHLLDAGARVPLPLAAGPTYLLVGKVVAARGRPCRVFVRVYGPDEPVEYDEPTSWSAAGPPVRADLVLNWLEVQVSGRRRQQFDELRLGTTWAAVTAPWAVR